jgi:hypothetical protein
MTDIGTDKPYKLFPAAVDGRPRTVHVKNLTAGANVYVVKASEYNAQRVIAEGYGLVGVQEVEIYTAEELYAQAETAAADVRTFADSPNEYIPGVL